jgi:hypothetical protein
MAYQPLNLPVGILADTEKLIRDHMEPHLIDVHSMFRLPIKDDPGLQGGCNFTIAQVLLSVVSGASIMLYDPAALGQPGERSRLFNEILTKYYPWDQEPSIAGAWVGTDAAKQLYHVFRNPLAHALGVIDAKHNPKGQRVVVEKGPFEETVIEMTERATVRPREWTNPMLRDEGDHLVLWVQRACSPKSHISFTDSLRVTEQRTT